MNIMLIEGHRMLATSLKRGLEKNRDISVIILDDIDNINKEIKSGNYDIIMIDINLNGLTKKGNGLSLSEKILEKHKDIKIVIITDYNLKYYQDIAKKIGCYGFISKEEETDSLLKKLNLIARGGQKIFPEDRQKEMELSPSEIEIVRLYSNCLSRKEVADKTYMSLSSLAATLNRIYQKLNVKNHQQMLKKARELGYIEIYE